MMLISFNQMPLVEESSGDLCLDQGGFFGLGTREPKMLSVSSHRKAALPEFLVGFRTEKGIRSFTSQSDRIKQSTELISESRGHGDHRDGPGGNSKGWRKNEDKRSNKEAGKTS